MSVVAARVFVWKGVRLGRGGEEGEEEAAELAACWVVSSAVSPRLLLSKASTAIPPVWQQLNQGSCLRFGYVVRVGKGRRMSACNAKIRKSCAGARGLDDGVVVEKSRFYARKRPPHPSTSRRTRSCHW
jgi:hypothetical protein